jgi:hypothetical protein
VLFEQYVLRMPKAAMMVMLNADDEVTDDVAASLHRRSLFVAEWAPAERTHSCCSRR